MHSPAFETYFAGSLWTAAGALSVVDGAAGRVRLVTAKNIMAPRAAAIKNIALLDDGKV